MHSSNEPRWQFSMFLAQRGEETDEIMLLTWSVQEQHKHLYVIQTNTHIHINEFQTQQATVLQAATLHLSLNLIFRPRFQNLIVGTCCFNLSCETENGIKHDI